MNNTGRRKALKSQAQPRPVPSLGTDLVKTEPEIPCWVEDEQSVTTFPVSKAYAFNSITNPLIPCESTTPSPATLDQSPPPRIIFPLSPDHLITLLQYNVLRGCLTNRHLLSCLKPTYLTNECSSAALAIVPSPSKTQAIPPSLYPTVLQRTVPHEDWIDIIPHPVWRDNFIRAIGTFDEDELWADTVGGLFEGFPDSETERRGVIAWSPAWHVGGWELSEGFWRKWRWSLEGCEDVLEATNSWRNKRGEKPLCF